LEILVIGKIYGPLAIIDGYIASFAIIDGHGYIAPILGEKGLKKGFSL